MEDLDRGKTELGLEMWSPMPRVAQALAQALSVLPKIPQQALRSRRPSQSILTTPLSPYSSNTRPTPLTPQQPTTVCGIPYP